MDGLMFYRAGNWCCRHGVPVMPALMKAATRVVFGAHVPCEATIGRTTMLGYGGLGTIIHPRVTIGENVMVGPHVTIGGRSRHEQVPVIGDNVMIGAGACILGPVTIGDGAVIGANAVVIEDVPPGCVAAGVPSRIVKRGVVASDFGDLPEDVRARKGRRS